jgi:hypothetical protein
MNEQYQKLVSLIECLPGYNSSRAYSEFNSILTTYSAVLNDVSSCGEEYKRTANLHYPNVSSIRETIQLSLEDMPEEQKLAAFEKAKGELKSNITALASLLKPKEENVLTS